MRRANPSLNAVSLKALAVIALSASSWSVAQPAPLPTEAPLPAPAAAATPAAPRAPSSAAVLAAAVGKQEGSPATHAGTLRELENLQRETALAEARKKLRDLSPTPQAVAAPAPGAAAPMTPGVKAKAKKAVPAVDVQQYASSNAAPLKASSYIEPPKAKLVNLMVIGGRARADVMDGTRMFTIKEGDNLGAWTVARIAGDGVTVERRYTESIPGPTAAPPAADGMRRPVAEAFSSAYAFINSAHPSYVEVDKVDTRLLQSASQGDIAVALAGSTMQLSTAGNAAAAMPPPLPSVGKPDSTAASAVPPLPPALGGNPEAPFSMPMPSPAFIPPTSQPASR